VFALILPDLGDAAVDRPYTYLIPSDLQAAVAVGGRVRAPLGKRSVSGYVLAVTGECDLPPAKVKPLLAALPGAPAFTAEQAALARWLAEAYLCPLSEALRPCLADPGGLAAGRWRPADSRAVTTLLPDPTANAVLAYLRERPGASSLQIHKRFGDDGAAALDTLRRDGLIHPMSGKSRRERTINAVRPALPPKDLLRIADDLPAKAAKQAALLRWAAAEWPPEPLTAADAARLARVTPTVVRACVQKGWLSSDEVSLRRNPWDAVQGRKAQAPELAAQQRLAVDAINASIQKREIRSFLLYGITGSGKTEVFLHAIEETLAAGRQAIVLVPEISLTAQAMALYHGRFPGKVAVLHSHLSPGERYDEWMRIAHGEARVVLGARSAIFAPCPDLGLIVIDEEHESSYKQESSPRYHAKAVALERGRLCRAPVVLASATPSLESMHEADRGFHVLLRLPERIEARPLPPVKLVDLKFMTKRARILSAPLREAITARLAAGEQVILFLNRRGFMHILLCPKCREQETCPHCAVPLTYHKAAAMLRCHHCDFAKHAGMQCRCGGAQIPFRGVGTEQLEEEVAGLWPEARVGRLDRDTTARRGAHQAILDRFGDEETDILIGTQMVAKGFDFPKVTLVGVIAADISLGAPDFRAPERTFQLLTQVAGRAGRANLPGEVIVQTWQPRHYAVLAAAEHDYQTFYQQEIVARGDSEACWPPLTALINIMVSGESETEVASTAAALARKARESAPDGVPLPGGTVKLPLLLGLFDIAEPEDAEEAETPANLDPFGAAGLLARSVPGETVVDGPAPCPLARLRNRYRHHLILRGQHRPALLRLARALQQITPPKGVQVVFDVDPLSLT
jgi:primosomal protein N' (replication factor Y)